MMNGPRLPGACAARAAAPKRARRQASEDTISPDYSIFRDSTESAVPAAARYAAENEKSPPSCDSGLRLLTNPTFL